MPVADPSPPRLLETRDLADALALSTAAGWNQRIEDWRLLETLARGRAFAAESGGRVIGTSMAIDYGGFDWIAMMLVDPAHRGRGLGAQLLEAALGTVAPGRTVRLDATPAGRPLYARHGFHDESTLTRYVGSRAALNPRPQHAGRDLIELPIRPLTPDDMPALLCHDAALFGGDRERLLAWMIAHAPGYAWIADRGADSPAWAFGRSGRLFEQLGPAVAPDDRTAIALLAAGLSAVGARDVVVDLFDARGGVAAWLTAQGFVPQRPLYRMARPPAGVSRPTSFAKRTGLREYAIAGPDLA